MWDKTLVLWAALAAGRTPEVLDLAAGTGRYDAVVSAPAIHHLDDDGRRALYRRAAEALAPGGVLVDAEQVAGPTPALDRRYGEVWPARITELGSDAAEIAGAGVPERDRVSGSATGASGDDWRSYQWVICPA